MCIRDSDSARLQAVQSQGWALVASLRSSSAVLYSVMPQIADSFDSMIGLTINSIQAETMDILSESDVPVSGDVLATVKCALQRHSDTLSHPLDMLSTKYKQDQYFD